jgi:hypothetical protein
MSNSRPQDPATVRKAPEAAPVPAAPNQSFNMKSKSVPTTTQITKTPTPRGKS